MQTTSLPLVVFTRIPADPDLVRKMVGVSRLVARWNGNRVGRRPINLITDDFELARAALTDHDERAFADEQMSIELKRDNSGLFWPDSGVMWSRANEFRVGQNIRTFSHETAHAIVRGEHHCGWRRMYSMLLPLWWKAFRPWDDFGLNLRFEIAHVVRHYAGGRMSAERQRLEVDSHVAASNRAFHRWAHLIVTG